MFNYIKNTFIGLLALLRAKPVNKDKVTYTPGSVLFSNVQDYATKLAGLTGNEFHCASAINTLKQMAANDQCATRLTLTDTLIFDGETKLSPTISASYYKYAKERWNMMNKGDGVQRSVIELLMDEFVQHLGQSGWGSMNDSASFLMRFIEQCVKSNCEYARDSLTPRGITSTVMLQVHFVYSENNQSGSYELVAPYISANVVLAIAGQAPIRATQIVHFARTKSSNIENEA